jgi:hypothetical protein
MRVEFLMLGMLSRLLWRLPSADGIAASFESGGVADD